MWLMTLGRSDVDKSAHRHRRLLRTRSERPCCRSTAEKCDELASLHVPSARDHALCNGYSLALCDHAVSGNHGRCPLWVKSRHVRCNKPCPLYTQYRPRKRTSAKRHVCFTPESGHVRCTSVCPLGPITRHLQCNIASMRVFAFLSAF